MSISLGRGNVFTGPV